MTRLLPQQLTSGRLAAHTALAMWEGGLGLAWIQNFLDGRWLYLVVNSVLLVGIFIASTRMRRHDRERGRLV